jgi:hypothetical protein
MLELPTEIPDIFIIHLLCHSFFDKWAHPRYCHILERSQIIFWSSQLNSRDAVDWTYVFIWQSGIPQWHVQYRKNPDQGCSRPQSLGQISECIRCVCVRHQNRLSEQYACEEECKRKWCFSWTLNCYNGACNDLSVFSMGSRRICRAVYGPKQLLDTLLL